MYPAKWGFLPRSVDSAFHVFPELTCFEGLRVVLPYPFLWVLRHSGRSIQVPASAFLVFCPPFTVAGCWRRGGGRKFPRMTGNVSASVLRS